MVKKKKKTVRKKTVKKKKAVSNNLGSAMIKRMLGGSGDFTSALKGQIPTGIDMSGGYGGPGTHAPVKASGAAVGKMADGRLIHLTGPKMGQMV